MEFPKSETGLRDEYGWSAEELKMSLLYQAFYLDFFPEDGDKRSIKSAARWDGHKKQVIVRAVDGFTYTVNNVDKFPDEEQIQQIHHTALMAWRTWYMEQLEKPENTLEKDSTLH